MELRKSPQADRILEVRISDHRPIAKHQWLLRVKLEKGVLPDFDPGNFCMISLPELVDPLTPRPFAIVSRDEEGAYEFIYRTTGKFTKLLMKMSPGQKLGLLGPLGKGIPAHTLDVGKHIFIAGGVGYASVLPLLNELASKNSGDDRVRVFYGVREDLELIRRNPFPVDVASDDGSIGFFGRLPELLEMKRAGWSDGTHFYICGPTGMMKAVYDLLPKEKSFYFLEETMGCGFGICIGCVVPVNDGGVVKKVRSCLEGPIFLGSRLTAWKEGKW